MAASKDDAPPNYRGIGIGAAGAERLAKIRLVCCDMDGTWLGPDHRPTEGGRRAMQIAEQSGMVWAFATGRCALSAENASGLQLAERPGIYSNGAVVKGAGGNELYALNLSQEVIAIAVRLAEEESEVAVILNDRDDFFCVNGGAELGEHALHLHNVYGDPKPQICAEADQVNSVQLIHIVGRSADIDRLESVCRERIGARAAVARNLPTDLVITHPSAHKGHACAQLAESLGLSIGEQVLGIGDSGNDVTMLQSVGIGVAMLNARAETLAAAEFRTTKPNGAGVCTSAGADAGAVEQEQRVGVLEVLEAVTAAVLSGT